MFGLRNDAIIGGLLPNLESAELSRLAAHKESLFRASARGALERLPGVRALLDTLDGERVPTAIVTSTPRENLALILDTLHLTGRFTTLVAEEDAERGKPDPQGFLIAAERLGIEPERCVVIEDAPAGLRAAKTGGMRAIGVTSTHPAPDLGDADLIVASLAEGSVRKFILGGRSDSPSVV